MCFRKYLLFLTMLAQSYLIQARIPAMGAQIGAQTLPNISNVMNIIGIYPNPAVDYIIIEIKKSQLQNARFILTSMIGNKIEVTPETLGDGKFRIDLMGFPTGFYFLVIQDDISQFKKALRFLIK